MATLLQRSILQQVLKARKEEVFESSTTKIWHERKDEHGTQVSRYDFLKGIFE